MDPEEEARMGIFCDCAIPRTPGPAVLFSTRLEPGERERYVGLGSASFTRHCGGCHGQQGEGDGPAAVSLLPAPRDLTAARFSDRALSRALWSGVPGSSMPGWHDLPVSELRGLAAYVRSLGPKADTEQALSPAELARTRPLYTRNCANCHGANGQADGISAAALAPRPTNFQAVQPTQARAEEAIAGGVPGASMPPWKDKLTAAQVSALAHFVRSLYQESPLP
jgi:mono/diheme cytochrome c family protein